MLTNVIFCNNHAKGEITVLMKHYLDVSDIFGTSAVTGEGLSEALLWLRSELEGEQVPREELKPVVYKSKQTLQKSFFDFIKRLAGG